MSLQNLYKLAFYKVEAEKGCFTAFKMPRDPDNNNYNYYNNDNYAIHFPKAQNYLILSCSHFGFQMTEVLFGHRISC